MGKRGLRSLTAAVPLSAALTALSFFNASSSSPLGKAAAVLTVAIVRAGLVASEVAQALAAWMAWAEDGLHACSGAARVGPRRGARGPCGLRGHGRQRRGMR
jgi:hypothetical protein